MPEDAIYVLCFYTLLPIFEGLTLTRFIQKKAVRLPPVLTILSRFLMWNIAGVLGFAFAVPMTTVALALLKRVT